MSGSVSPIPSWNNSCTNTLNALSAVSYDNTMPMSREDKAYTEGLCNDVMYAIAAAGG